MEITTKRFQDLAEETYFQLRQEFNVGRTSSKVLQHWGKRLQEHYLVEILMEKSQTTREIVSRLGDYRKKFGLPYMEPSRLVHDCRLSPESLGIVLAQHINGPGSSQIFSIRDRDRMELYLGIMYPYVIYLENRLGATHAS